MRNIKFAWLAVGLLALLCGVVAFLQYSWIGEISVAERQRLQEALQDRMSRVQRAFNAQQRALTTSLVPGPEQIKTLGREKAYEARYQVWASTHEPAFRHIALAIPRNGDELVLEEMKLDQGRFEPTQWTADWEGMRQYLSRRLPGRDRSGPPEGADDLRGSFQLELPRFAEGREQEWLILEFDPGYMRQKFVPTVLRSLLSESGSVKYDAAVMTRTSPVETIYESAPNLHLDQQADASTTLFQSGPGRGGPPQGPPRGPANLQWRPEPPRPPDNHGPDNAGRWVLLARHRAGSLEALVEQTRRRNLALSGGLLLLILGTAAALVHYSRQAQQLAETRMNFVAGVSHELRTPLTVIRTASFNLRGKLAHNPSQVERYGRLIQGESERLSKLVEQVLLFANAKTGSLLRKLSPHSVEPLIHRTLEAVHRHLPPEIVIVTLIPPDLSMVLTDEIALTHALENLIDNAVKHGSNADPHITVFAREVEERGKAFVEIGVVDHGPGIPPEEQAAIFEPFYRGRRATMDQIRGTGLGLDLVKKIAEAHGGSVRLSSAPLQRTEFVLRLPAAPAQAIEVDHEPQVENEFAHPAD